MPDTRPADPLQAPGEAAACVLLVDDDPLHLEYAEDLLRAQGLRVETARHGAKAVTLASRRRHALVLMDLQMPVMDGLEATRQIRAALGPQLPIVALTANSSAADRQACTSAGMNDHLSKPIDLPTLRHALQRWLPPGSLKPLGGAAGPDAKAGATAPAALAALAQRLDAIEGFDLATSLHNLNGQLPRLQRVLRRFADTYRLGEPELLQAAESADVALGWQLCHSLRGACSTLAARRLVQHIEAFESSLLLRAEPGVLLGSAQALQAELLALAGALDAALQT